ncbi:glycosyltransferase [Scytonema sp. UIC 10036]|uniref:glycosyltransferase n=1 Tax=Scytonema sp. UIC 10036 TaxID=2304196 RepID=UPI001FA9B60B|nr:glycosyltransferase [Scytonema sp. UIC 10036]
MRILMVASGGIAMLRPLKWALEAGHEVWLVCPHNPYPLKETPNNYRYIPFILELVNYYEHTGELPKDEQTHQLLLWTAASQLRAIANEFQPNIIHVHGMYFGAECCALAELHPLIVSAWGSLNSLIETQEEQSKKISKLAGIMFKAADVLIVEAPSLLNKCKLWINQFQRVELIHLGTKTQHFCPQPLKYVNQWRQALDIPNEAKVLLSARGWSKIYSHHQILEAFAMAYPHLQKQTVLVFMKLRRTHSLQEAKEYYNDFCIRAKQLGMEQNIRWLPSLPHDMVPTAYSLADAIVNYPISDAFPSTLVEAVACQTQVITTRLPAYQGTFVEEFCTVVEPQNPTALAKALIEVVNNSTEEREYNLVKARQFIIKNYDEEVFKEKLLTIYQEVASKAIRFS